MKCKRPKGDQQRCGLLHRLRKKRNKRNKSFGNGNGGMTDHSTGSPMLHQLQDMLQVRGPHRAIKGSLQEGYCSRWVVRGSRWHSPEAKLLRELHAKLGSWKKVAARVGVNRGLAWMVATGKIQSPTVNAQLSRNFRQLEESSDCRFLRLIRRGVVPWLRAREHSKPEGP